MDGLLTPNETDEKKKQKKKIFGKENDILTQMKYMYAELLFALLPFIFMFPASYDCIVYTYNTHGKTRRMLIK